jgi:hypothetical protein
LCVNLDIARVAITSRHRVISTSKDCYGGSFGPPAKMDVLCASRREWGEEVVA